MRGLDRAAKLIAMGATKYPQVVLVSIFLIAGLLCSQVCDFTCAFYGCSLSSPVKAAEGSGEHSHCHQHKQSPRPQERNGSRECPGHFEALAAPSSFVTSASALNNAIHVEAPVITPLLSYGRLNVGVSVQTDRAPDRSPPPHSILRI